MEPEWKVSQIISEKFTLERAPRSIQVFYAVMPRSFLLPWVSKVIRFLNPANCSGVNPLATISALAERTSALLAEKYNFSIDLKTQNGNVDYNSTPRLNRSRLHDAKIANGIGESVGWQFTEVLKGRISISVDGDLGVPGSRGKSSSCAMTASLTIDLYKSKGTTNSLLQKPMLTRFQIFDSTMAIARALCLAPVFRERH
jgi:hypothetical protein